MLPSIQYFDRAAWATHNAMNDALPLNVRSHLTAVALHACHSLKESLDRAAEEGSDDPDLADALKKLPHTEVIENVRNMDLHGWPIPVCNPQVREIAIVSKPGHPVTLSSSHGVATSIQLDGLTPKIHRNPKDLKHGKVRIGGATVSYGCDGGKLIVHDFSTGKDVFLLGALKSFLQRCHPLLEDRMPSPDAETEQSTGPEE